MFESPGQAPMASPLYEPQLGQHAAEVRSTHMPIYGQMFTFPLNTAGDPMKLLEEGKKVSFQDSMGQK